jgi:hypothetical protein
MSSRATPSSREAAMSCRLRASTVALAAERSRSVASITTASSIWSGSIRISADPST